MGKDKSGKSRSEIQWDLFKFNIIWCGVAVGFGLKFTIPEALYLPPLISFMLFAYWFHQGVVIIVEKQEEGKNISDQYFLFRYLSILLALSANFIFLPILSIVYAKYLILPEDKLITSIDIKPVLFGIGIILLGMNSVLISRWIYIQYMKNCNR